MRHAAAAAGRRLGSLLSASLAGVSASGRGSPGAGGELAGAIGRHQPGRRPPIGPLHRGPLARRSVAGGRLAPAVAATVSPLDLAAGVPDPGRHRPAAGAAVGPDRLLPLGSGRHPRRTSARRGTEPPGQSRPGIRPRAGSLSATLATGPAPATRPRRAPGPPDQRTGAPLAPAVPPSLSRGLHDRRRGLAAGGLPPRDRPPERGFAPANATSGANGADGPAARRHRLGARGSAPGPSRRRAVLGSGPPAGQAPAVPGGELPQASVHVAFLRRPRSGPLRHSHGLGNAQARARLWPARPADLPARRRPDHRRDRGTDGRGTLAPGPPPPSPAGPPPGPGRRHRQSADPAPGGHRRPDPVADRSAQPPSAPVRSGGHFHRPGHQGGSGQPAPGGERDRADHPAPGGGRGADPVPAVPGTDRPSGKGRRGPAGPAVPRAPALDNTHSAKVPEWLFELVAGQVFAADAAAGLRPDRA